MVEKLAGALGVLTILGCTLLAAAGSVAPAFTSQLSTEGMDGLPASRVSYRRPAAIPFPAGNPYSRAKAELGRLLFFDPILSGSGTRSCASCHAPSLAWSDGKPRAVALGDGEMLLRTPTLIDVAWIDRLGWDGKFRDLESVAFTPITAKANMDLPKSEAVVRLAARPDYATAFAEAFPDEPGGPDGRSSVTPARIEQALATFERLLVAEAAPFDHWIEGDESAISTAAKRGFGLFTGKANCAACHGGPTLTDGSFHDIGVGRDGDVGRGRYFPRSPAMQYAFKTPTLRDVARRAPYMHDGSQPTLAAVIDLYDRGGIERPSRSREIRPLSLSSAEKSDLLAFLETLTGPEDTSRALGNLAGEPYRP